MTIQKNQTHFLFFDGVISIVALFLVSLAFFLGFDMTQKNLFIYAGVMAGVIFVGVGAFLTYRIFCCTCYVFDAEGLCLLKKNEKERILFTSQIRHAEYHRLRHLFLGDPKAGHLIICYIDGSDEKTLEISFPMSKIKDLPFAVATIK